MGGGDLGVHLVVCIVLAGGLGYGLDVWASSRPWGLIGGIALGFAAWLWQMWKMLRPAPPAKP
jgi:F0F1-type ATP synthase assembly protein I